MKTDRLDRIVGLIEERFRDPEFCVKAICMDLEMGMSALHELVSMRLGTTPHLLIEARRLTEAIALMKGDHCCLGAIVSTCGFSSVRTFRRVFEKRLGTTPRGAMGKLRDVTDGDKFYHLCLDKLVPVTDPMLTPLQRVGRNVRTNDRKVWPKS